jgi:iron(III) transport system permease protein
MKSRFWSLTTILIFLIFFFFMILPVLNLFTGSFQTQEKGAFTLQNYLSFFHYPSYWRSLWNSILIGLISAAGAMIVGVPMGYMVSRWNVMGKSLIVTLSTLPLMLPTFIAAFAWVILLGRGGIITKFLQTWGIHIGSIYGYPGMILVFVSQLYSYVFLMTLSGFSAVDESIEEAGCSLGSSQLRTFWTVSLPLVLPTILSGAILTFMSAIENFGVPMIIAQQTPNLVVKAYIEFTSEVGTHPGMAYTLSIFLILITMASLVAQRYYLSKRNFIQAARGKPKVKQLTPGKRLLASGIIYAFLIFTLIPFFVALVLSFMEMRGPVFYPRFSLQSYVYAFSRSARPIFNSYFLATISTLVAVLIGVPTGYILTRRKSAYSNALDIVIMLPFVIAGTILGIALITFFNQGWIVLTGTWVILVLSYVIRKMPFIARSSASILYQLDPSLDEASISLGVSPMKTFYKVTFRLMMGGVVSGAILSWVTIISELSSTLVLRSPSWSTMTVEMYQGVVSDDLGKAAAFSSIMIISTVIPLLLATKYFSKDKGGGILL